MQEEKDEILKELMTKIKHGVPGQIEGAQVKYGRDKRR